MSLQVRIDDLL